MKKKIVLTGILIFLFLFGMFAKRERTLEEVLDISGYSANDRRVFGFVSERLLDVWLITNNISYTELPVINMESQNWPKKIFNFLKRKFVGK